ncbi:MAG: hypothetical protein HQ567_18035 [Candidatus Nealsonbacteria bacterium]|nr:hypothetical protein [Candidatus Nealsonbacteria bacterium]
MNTLQVLLERIECGDVVSFTTFEEIDVETALDKREQPSFEQDWLDAFNFIEAGIQANPLSEDESKLIDAVREIAYKRTYAHTEDPDLCAYVSDDFELVGKALALSLEDTWANALWLSYKSEVFPCGKLKRVRGRLAELVVGS